MWVQFGNDHAVEAYRDDTAEDPGEPRYRPVEGRQITAVVMPEGWGLNEAFVTALHAAGHHLEVADPASDQKHPPAWIESDSEGLTALLVEHFGIKRNRRPSGWEGDHPSVAALRAGPADAG